MFSDRHRWVKFGAALAVLAALAAACAIVLPFLRPDLDRFETRAAQYDGREFSLSYERVANTYQGYFTLTRREVAGLHLTGAYPNCGMTVVSSDEVSVVGIFHQPSILVVTAIRKHPLRPWKFAAAVPAALFVALFAWRRTRFVRGQGLALEHRRGRDAENGV